MAVGALAINVQTAQEIEDRISKLRKALGISNEVKWSNAKARRDSGQKAYADLLRELVESKNAHFHIRFQEMARYDHKLSGPRRKSDTVSKAYYNLIVHRAARFYGRSSDLHIRPDDGDCTARLHRFIGNMNSYAAKRYATDPNCIRSIHCRESKATHHLQLLDVTLGAMAAIRNERQLGPAKRDLAEYIQELWDCDLTVSSPSAHRRFSVWNVTPSIARSPGAIREG